MNDNKIKQDKGNVNYSIWPIPIDFEPKSAEWWEKALKRMANIMNKTYLNLKERNK